jgi:hypothetical protein
VRSPKATKESPSLRSYGPRAAALPRSILVPRASRECLPSVHRGARWCRRERPVRM